MPVPDDDMDKLFHLEGQFWGKLNTVDAFDRNGVTHLPDAVSGFQEAIPDHIKATIVKVETNPFGLTVRMPGGLFRVRYLEDIVDYVEVTE